MCPGVHITRVVLVDNKALENRFSAQYASFKQLMASTGFKAETFQDPAKKALDKVLSRRLRDLESIRGLSVCFAGFEDSIATKICKSGLVNFKKTDAGYFGAGVSLSRCFHN